MKNGGRELVQALWSDEQQAAAQSVLRQIADEAIETIRIVFVDQHGITRGKTIMASALKSTFENGVTMTSTLLLKDTSHTTVFPVWQKDAGFGEGIMTGASDFLMVPDPLTFKVLPWVEKTGWMISDIHYIDGQEIELSTRRILKNALAKLNAKGMEFVCGLEVEFYVLRLDDPKLAHNNSNRPEDPPETSLIAHGYQYLTENRIDQLDDVMVLLKRNALALGLPLRTMESEFGPSQFEFTFDPLPGIGSADMMVLFRNMVKQVCQRHGYHATFMCRPNFKNAMGNGWHLHQSLVDVARGDNLFMPEEGQAISPIGAQWIAGLLAHASESCILTTPTINGYKRYQPHALAPDRIIWGRDNRGAMLRVLAQPGDNASRIENRVGEPAANPYLYLASQILSGMDGIEQDLQAPAAVEKPYEEAAEMLPDNLRSAIDCFKKSAFYQQAVGDSFVNYFSHLKQAEWKRYLKTVSDWEQREYFSLY